ncbi:MAG: ABC transporter ATP-binding protein [Oscillospiraceae bacterium]|nr:ABC transporter ATP-binding protein [Oscillospiraceae bacterium]
MDNAIEMKGITKKYKDFTLGEITTAIPCGFSTALIGANGAGKTTLIDLLCGVTGRSGGTATYFGKYTDIDEPQLRNMIGYCSSANFFPLDWTLRTIARSMELAFDNFNKDKYTALCRRLELGDPWTGRQKPLLRMSDGNRMRAALAAVFARDTKLLVLDEPSSSLDPLARDMLCELFREYLTEGNGERSILFSTHNISDMEFVVDHAIFMAHGQICDQGSVEDLKEKYVIVHGDERSDSRAYELLHSYIKTGGNFEGLALAENAKLLSSLDTAVEKPTLNQLSIGILRKAEKNGKK